MVKTRMIPMSKSVEIEIPLSYVGKNIEIQITSDSEKRLTGEDSKIGWIRRFKGSISSEFADKMNTEIRKLRNEWG